MHELAYDNGSGVFMSCVKVSELMSLRDRWYDLVLHTKNQVNICAPLYLLITTKCVRKCVKQKRSRE